MYALLRKLFSGLLLFIFSFQILVHSVHQYLHHHQITKTEKSDTFYKSSGKDCSICDFALPAAIEPTHTHFLVKIEYAKIRYNIFTDAPAIKQSKYHFSLRAPPYFN